MDFSQTHFELFGLPATYALDRELLDSAYRALQNQVHPDRFVAGPESGQRLAMQWSSRVNEAYQTLKNPISRAAYLLELQGIDALAASNTRIAPAFLMQQMEWREAISDAREKRDVSALDALQSELKQETRKLEAELLLWLDEDKNLEAAAESVRKLKFMNKLIAEIGDAYEEMEA